MCGAMSLPMLQLCGLVAYDGTDYHGFQLQSNVPTIQGALEAGLAKILPHPVRVVGAGRTDSGVHARGQVIAFQAPWRHPIEALQRAWNSQLPPSIAVRKLQPAPDGFHPRFQALDRNYRYRVVVANEPGRATPTHSPLTDRFALYSNCLLDLAAMNEAAQLLVGEHDFATFGQAPGGEQTVRIVHEARWQVVECGLPSLSSYPGQRIVFTIRANAFLYRMVRNLVGTMLEVGLGRRSPGDVGEALRACDRLRSAPPVSPQGLVLETVRYPAELGLQFESNQG
jgi:tRNA pseudouridine38-40 synthase